MYICDKPIPELDFLGFQRFLPHPELAPFIESYWVVDAMLEMGRIENLYPDGGCGLIFNFADALQIEDQLIHKDVVQELGETACPVIFQGRVSTIGVHFQPGGARAFFDVPARDWRCFPVSVDTFNAKLNGLYDDLGNMPNTGARLRHLDQVLRETLRERTDLSLVKGFKELVEGEPSQQVTDLASHLGVTCRQLERIFLEHVGLPPTHMIRLTRVAKARHLLKHHEIPSLSFLGQELGYYDQGHFIRDFKRIMCMTPGAYRKRAKRRKTNH